MHHWTRNFLANLLAACVLAFAVTDATAANRVVLGNAVQTPLAASTDANTVNTLAALHSRAATDGKVRAIVGVRAPFAPEGGMNAASVVQQRNEIARMHSAVHAKNPSLKSKPGKSRAFSTIPFMAVEVDAAELEALAGQTEITSIEEDRVLEPMLAESVPLIGGTAAWSSGYTGAGQTIAVIDTGVDSAHPFLFGKIVSEACYSTNYAAAGASSLCPGGVTQSAAAGSGVNCDTAISGCSHGTHVAGITAGDGASFSGVARDASLIAIKVFTRFDNVAMCGSAAPCIGAYTSDVNLALEQVYLLRNAYNIAAVNMSLGGGAYSGQASCDAANTSTKTAIDNLRSVNIATVIASGNNGYNSLVSSPGCISSAVSVGATTKTDVVDWYSNSASFLNLLAPGSSINSSIPGAAYAVYSGTSMATPHVAGSWALLKQQNPNLTVTDGLNLLTATGTPITDTRNGIVKPRIQIDAALNVALNEPPTLNYSAEIGYGSNGVSPASGTASTRFTYKVVYTDMTNIAPSSIRACIDDICNAMSKDTGAADPALRDSSFTNGEQYVYTSTLVAGAHSYYFDATRGATTVTLPASGALSAPTVSDLAISTTTLPNGDVGIAYISNPQASGGTPPYSWSASGLPGGLSIYSASGVISGTPTRSGLFGFMVSVSDAASAVFSKVFSIVIVDNVVPTVPTGLTASAASATQINLSWSASTDNVGVTGYKVYRDGVQVGNPVGTFFIDTGLTAATAYNYTVAACDAAGNCSAQSNIVSATTLVGTTPGTLVAWGYNAYGQATVPSGLNGVVAVAAGFGHTVALKNDGTLAAWGYNALGQATIPSGLSGVVAVAAGNLYTVALKNDGKVVAWGDNAYGQTSVPVGLSGVVAIAAKSITTVALKNDGTVVAWGDNTNGVTSVPAGLSGVVAIASGNNHIVALKNDGTVVAWGGNNSGETTVPQGLNGVVAIAAGMYHTVALKSDGTVVTWGYNSNGQMSVPSGLSGVAAIAANLATTVALKNDGTVVAWGDNTYGQTMIPASLSGVTSISAGAYHTVAVFVDNTVPSVPTGLTASASNASQINLSWTASSDNVGVGGYKVYRNGVQVGTSTLTSFSDTGLTAATTYNYTVAACDAAGNCSAQSTAVSVTTPVADSEAPTVPTGLAASASSATQINLSWAASTDNIGVTGYKVYRNGVQVGVLAGAAFIDTGLAAATAYSYTVAACDAAGNCSEQSTAVSATTLAAQAISPSIAAGSEHSVALDSSGAVLTWGYNGWGGLGDGTITHRSSPVVVPGLFGVTAVSAGTYNAFALKSDGSVWSWGSNNWGQLGDGTTINRLSPVAVPGLSGIAALDAGANHTVALKSDGTVLAWGFNSSGQLGDGTTTNRINPVAVPGLSGVVAVAAGGQHTVALKSDGSVLAWGLNSSGQIGDGTTTNRINPVVVPGLSGVVAVAATGSYTVALKSDGAVVAWGDNYYGQLGDGTTVNRLNPKVVPGLSGVVAVAPGSIHMVALKSDGTLLAWGNNYYGQLGDGTTIQRLSPIVVPGVSGVMAVTTWYTHTVALKSDGTVHAWGYNSYGQLGFGYADAARYTSAATVGVGGIGFLNLLNSDNVAPTVPTGLTASAVSATQINLSWAASTDNVEVTAYKAYRNGVQAGTPTGASFSDTGLTAATTYNYTVVACDAAGNCSAQSAAVSAITSPADTTPPAITPSVPGGVYNSAQNVTLSANEPATIYYTLDGSTPTTASMMYSAVIAVNSSLTLKYFAVDTAGNASAVQAEVYVIDTVAPTVAASVAGGTYSAVQNVTLSANEPATIYYTLDDTMPTTASAVYTAPISISTTKILKYFGKDTAGNASAVQTQVYVIDSVAPTVTASVAGGTYTSVQSVTLIASEPATIYFTLDGTMPTTASAVYSAAITVNSSLTLKYFAVDTAGNVGAVLTQVFVIDTVAPTVTASVAGGTYISVQSVTLIASEPATIYFTLDGTMPTTASAVYSAAITVNSSLTLKYFAVDTAGNVGAVQTQVYVINLLDTIAPVSSVLINGGAPVTFTATVALTIAATDNSGTVAQMRFSNNGTNWSAWEAYATSKAWTLSTGFGNKTVYAQSKDAAGNISVGVSDSINYFPDVDLAPILLSTTATSVKTGRSLTVRDTVKNQGNVATTASNFKMSYYLSIDPAITSADIRIGSRTISSLAAGASNTASTTLAIPTNMARGVYYLGVVADSANVQPENNETNNTLAGKTIIIQ